MLHARSDEATAAGRPAYAACYSVPMHADIQSSSTDIMQRPYHTSQNGIQPAYEYPSSVSNLTSLNIDNISASNSKLCVNAEPGLRQYQLQQQQQQQQQPSFMRRPYRYQKKGSKSTLSSKLPGSVTPNIDQDEEGNQWDLYMQSSQHQIDPNATRPNEYACHTEPNNYASLYQDFYAHSLEGYSVTGDTSLPSRLSPLIDSASKQTAQHHTTDKPDSTNSSIKSVFLPSPDSSCPSPVLSNETYSKKPRGYASQDSRVSKGRFRRSIKRGVRERQARIETVKLTSEEEKTLGDIFERQFDIMCRAVITEFNASHMTQIGADLVLQLVQQKDLKNFKTTWDMQKNYTNRGG